MEIKFRNTRLSIRPRFIIVFVIYVIVAALCALRPFIGFLFLIIVPALLFVSLWLLKNKNPLNNVKAKKVVKGNEPQQGQIWKPVTVTEIDRLRERIRSINKIKVPFIFNPKIRTWVTFVFFIIAFLSFVINWTFLSAIISLYFIFVPFFWFAGLNNLLPPVADKLNVFSPLFSTKLPDSVKLSPLLLFDTRNENPLPSDIRVMLAPGNNMSRKVRDELLGAQFQMSYNTGPDGKVPYMYAVFITKGRGSVWQSLKTFTDSKYAVEAGSSTEDGKEYGTVVIRKDGYHTTESNVINLVDTVLGIMKGKL